MYIQIKRVIDFIIALCGMPVLGIILLFSSVCIKIEDGGPIFYMAERIGKDGKIFKMYKIRSMKVDAPDIRLEDGSTFNAENDPRITKFGHFARKTSIDEIPQLINILKGEMSLIGPRPDSANWIDNYTPKERMVFKVRPGITGYNQVINRNAVGTKEKLKNDIYYVNNISFFFDVKIFFRTIVSVLSSKNVYRIKEREEDKV